MIDNELLDIVREAERGERQLLVIPLWETGEELIKFW